MDASHHQDDILYTTAQKSATVFGSVDGMDRNDDKSGQPKYFHVIWRNSSA